MSVVDDLNTVVSDLDTLKVAVEAVATELNTPTPGPTPSVGDQVLEASITVLTNAGYTVTAPAPAEQPAPEDPTQTDQPA